MTEKETGETSPPWNPTTGNPSGHPEKGGDGKPQKDTTTTTTTETRTPNPLTGEEGDKTSNK